MILDASAVVPLFIPDDLTDSSRTLIAANRFAAPAYLLVEASNALWKYAIRGGLETADVVAALTEIEGLCDDLVPDDQLLPEAIELAVAFRHPVYDCLYLALAQRRRESLATADRKLAALARQLDIRTELLAST